MRIHLLNVEFDTLTLADLNRVISDSVYHSESRIVAYHNLHSVYLFQYDHGLREYYKKADVIHIDGMSIIYIARLFGFSLLREQRVTYLDWIYPLMEKSASEGWKVFYLGGKPGVAEKAAEVLRKQYCGLQIRTHHGYFGKENKENEAVLQLINSYQPDLLLVGMGMPTQEHWILQNYSKVNECVILAPGACFDYIAGEIPTPPRWMGRIGLEWLFRLASEPKRLWKRYLWEPWHVLFLIMKELYRS